MLPLQNDENKYCFIKIILLNKILSLMVYV